MRFNVGQEVELHRECAKAAQGLAVSRKKPCNNVVNYAVSNFYDPSSPDGKFFQVGCFPTELHLCTLVENMSPFQNKKISSNYFSNMVALLPFCRGGHR